MSKISFLLSALAAVRAQVNGFSDERTIEYDDGSMGVIKLTYSTYNDGFDPYYVGYLKGKLEVKGIQPRKWSTSDRAHFRMCLELGAPDTYK